MKICVTGVGYVGLVAAACLAEGGNHVICVDNDQNKIENLKNGIIPIYEPGLTEIVQNNYKAGRLIFTTDLAQGVAESLIIYLAVGTPSADDGSADISAVLDVAGQVAKTMDGYRIIVTKSTVPVGTHKKVAEVISAKTSHSFDYVSNPEFLKEGSAVEDFMKPDRVIIGTTNPAVTEIMKQLYSPFMRKSGRLYDMDPASAEMAKYASNAMLATRISFMNEIARLCDKVGADVEQVRQGMGSDCRIGNAFLFPGVGFGGSCFPKDVRALIHMGNQVDCPMTVARSVQQTNLVQHDYFADTILNYFGEQAKDITVACWGLAFKARTDDIRESPAIHCINRFLDAGMKVKAYDPEAMENTKMQLGDKIQLLDNSYDALEGCDVLVIFTDWQEFRNPDFEAIAKKLSKPVLFDGRNLYDKRYVAKQGIEYYSIGRP
ncbi:MAG: UDP-glucose/GDP-mannose dehydrogenase family protein [Phycisphaerae bacterium]|nr:UDP-glucose/GDP-mannose dehydrogenase family protein [Phycisphaerae bacterium]